MTGTANVAQFEAWNGGGGRRWVASADERDRILAPVADALLTLAAPTPGLRVLDVGCGCGATALEAAVLVGDTGSVTGLDLSEPMLEVARQRARASGATNPRFVQADAQTHRFESGSADLVISRFGTMFFSDPDVAFANIGTALTDEGRMCFTTWQPLAANEWLAVAAAALLLHTDVPPTVDGPGMFGQSDPDVVTATLRAAGFGAITVEAAEVTFTIGQTIDDALKYVADTGLVRALLETIPEGAAREAALGDVRDRLAAHHDPSGVRLGGGIWLITATR
jgi:SAM-dependent methyltransferase